MINRQASLESQLESKPIEVEDTEEMFWLREADDYQSKVQLGNALSSQYRFIEAIEVFNSAARIRSDDPILYIRIGGANLSVFNFSESLIAYKKALSLGADEKTVAYPLGIWHYLNGNFLDAAKYFEKCLPCSDEMKIAVIYWHCLCMMRSERTLEMLNCYNHNMNVGHHTAYEKAVSLFEGHSDAKSLLNELEKEDNDLNYIICAYGVCRYLFNVGENESAIKLINKILEKNSIWACISYLAAWNDNKNM